jgi:hypothetical protein
VRKQAFVELGNLMTSFQRMEQEPKSKQSKCRKLAKITGTNHTLLSASSLEVMFRRTKLPKHLKLNVVITAVTNNLNSISVLSDAPTTYINLDKEGHSFKKFKSNSTKEMLEGNMEDDKYLLKMQEFQLVIEQLIWLTSLSESILKSSKILDFT